MSKKLEMLGKKIKKLTDKKTLIEKQLESLFIEKQEVHDKEIVVMCNTNHITLEELAEFIRQKKMNKGVDNYENNH